MNTFKAWAAETKHFSSQNQIRNSGNHFSLSAKTDLLKNYSIFQNIYSIKASITTQQIGRATFSPYKTWSKRRQTAANLRESQVSQEEQMFFQFVFVCVFTSEKNPSSASIKCFEASAMNGNKGEVMQYAEFISFHNLCRITLRFPTVKKL